jgi:hypothetical protein
MCGELKFKSRLESWQHLIADCASNKIISGEWKQCGEKMVDLSKDTWFFFFEEAKLVHPNWHQR